jgi:hypothetical protein
LLGRGVVVTSLLYYAICVDRTPDRATVSTLYASSSQLRLAITKLGAARLELIAVVSTKPLMVGQRIWHGARSTTIAELSQ